jgi:hypothetical protein
MWLKKQTFWWGREDVVDGENFETKRIKSLLTINLDSLSLWYGHRAQASRPNEAFSPGPQKQTPASLTSRTPKYKQ